MTTQKTDERRELWWPSSTVELGKVVELDLEEPFETVHGAQLDKIQVSYESWGKLGSARDNVILVAHPLAMDCHVTGDFAGQELGWWEPIFGPGRAIDTEHFGVNVQWVDAMTDEVRAAVAGRRDDLPAEAFVGVGASGLAEKLEAFLEVGLSKFVVRPMLTPDNWSTAVESVSDVLDMQN